jgi:hypothetical protein
MLAQHGMSAIVRGAMELVQVQRLTVEDARCSEQEQRIEIERERSGAASTPGAGRR